MSRVVQALADAGVDYMVTGSVVSSFQGEPRLSHDIDLVVSLPVTAIEPLLAAFPPDQFFLQREVMEEAVRRGTMFNMTSYADGTKVDFWMLTDSPFDQSRFARKRLEPINGFRVYLSSPEDTILAKLRWAKLSGGSEKQFTDALRVFELQRPVVDLQYLERWAKELEVESLWGRLRAEGEHIDSQ